MPPEKIETVNGGNEVEPESDCRSRSSNCSSDLCKLSATE